MQFDRVVCDSTKRITGAYGWMTLPDGTPYNHKGIDLGWRTDEEQNKVFANCYGVVAYTEDGLGRGEGASGWGNYVLVRHPNGMYSRYCHLRKGLPVHIGQEVDETNMLGIMGDSGKVSGRHLHFEVQTNKSADSRIDPTPYLREPIWKPETNLKYRASTKEEGWGEWKNAGDTAGSVGFGYGIDLLQIDSKEPMKVQASIEDTGWVDFGEINKDTIIGIKGKAIECLLIEGNYTIRILAGKWSNNTITDGKVTVGSVGEGIPIEAIKMVIGHTRTPL